jgi:hypothetical protein
MSSPDRRTTRRGRRARRLLASLLYWAAVLAISLALVVGLILLLESRDQSDVGAARGAERASAARAPALAARTGQGRAGARSSRAKTTIRLAAL